MPRKNDIGVEEVASIRTNMETFGKEHERIFGKKESPFCEKCEKRFAFCECPKEETCLAPKEF